MSDDIDTLFPGREVTLRTGEKVALAPLFFGQYPKAIKLLRPLVEAVRGAGIAGFDGKTFTFAPDWPLRLPQVMDEAGETLIEFVAFGAGKPRVWFDTLGGDDGIALTRAVFEVNGDFFIRRIAPTIGFAVQPETMPADGVASSPDSSAPATAETASTA